MDRQPLADGTWIDLDTASHYDEDTVWDGSNHISCATGSQWAHERLFRAASQRWVLYCWAQWQDSKDSWREIDTDTAARWLVKSGHTHPDAADAIAMLEV